MTQFKRGLSRKINSGEIGQEVRTKVRYKKRKRVADIEESWIKKLLKIVKK